jgi:hypothetical protein
VLRDERTVFDEAAARSFIGKPITDNHPKDPVTAANWKDHARGMVMGAMRDGEYLAFDLLLTDAATIKKVDDGKRELSNGYAAELEFGDFQAPDGTKCAARQVKISGNHVALVDQGRAGAECRIADAANCESIPQLMLADIAAHLLGDGETYRDSEPGDNKSPHQRRETVDKGVGQVATETMQFDGMPIEVTDQSKAAILKLQGQLADSATKLSAAEQSVKDEQAKIVERDATITAKDAKITELEGQLKDTAITPAKLADAAKAYADVCAKAKSLGVTFAEDADADAVKKAVVAAKMGDAAKDYGAEHIAIAFDALTKDAKPADPLRATLKDGIKPAAPVGREGVDKARAAWLADKENGHRGPSIEVEA